jgi:hypothetical protein
MPCLQSINLLTLLFMRDFQHSVNILIKAYLNDSLIFGACAACACGNLISGNLNVSIINPHCTIWRKEDGKRVVVNWGNYDFPTDFEDVEEISSKQATGYTDFELRRIENAFEYANPAHLPNSEKDMFIGLVAVFNELASIHQVDLTTKTEALEALQAVKSPLQ